MKITRDNYETFFLDYLEGNLKESMIDEFLDFLKLNPDLKTELHLFEQFHLPEQQVVFSGKKHLYKLTDAEKTAFEIKTIALMEGDLKEEEQLSFKAHLADHPELQKEYDLMTKTRLVADSRIKYRQKNNLYKKSGTILYLNWAARVAAVAVLLWSVNILFQTGSQIRSPKIIQKIASLKTEPFAHAKKSEPTVKTPEIDRSDKIAGYAKPVTPNKSRQIKENASSTTAAITSDSPSQERDLTIPEGIIPISASLETHPLETPLAVSHSGNLEKIKDSRNILTLDKFLASRVKRLGGDGLLSANKIIRTGLNLASELSGDRLGYKVKNGKVTSLDFESKLMAFSIPLQKK